MAMNPERSEQFYSDFIKAMKKAYCEEKIKGILFLCSMDWICYIQHVAAGHMKLTVLCVAQGS